MCAPTRDRKSLRKLEIGSVHRRVEASTEFGGNLFAFLDKRWEADMRHEYTWFAGQIRTRVRRVAYGLERLLRQGIHVCNPGFRCEFGRMRTHDSRERAAIHSNLFPIDMNSVLARQHCNRGGNDLRAAGRA